MNEMEIPLKDFLDPNYLDNEKAEGCHYTSEEIDDQYSFIWYIDDWNELRKKERTYSQEFEVGKNKWNILLMPNENESKNKDISLFLNSVNASDKDCPPQWYCCSHFSLGVVNSNDMAVYVRHTSHRFNTLENDWGFKSFMNLSKLNEYADNKDNEDVIVKNNKFRIVANVRIIKDTTGVLWSDMKNWDSKKNTGYVGLKNQGATCYMNSLLQSLNFISLFKKATFEIPTEKEKPKQSVPLALQRVFYHLQHSNVPVDTRELTSSFGWDTMESFMQHDIQEFNRVLQDNLEDKMKKTKAEGAISNIFKGKMKSYIKCVDVEYTSSRIEDYYDIQLNVKGCKDVLQSFNEYIDVETLDGDNKYMAEGHGLQVAKKGVIFQSFPPVLQLHLKRFEYDMERDAMVKINDRYEYPETINLSKYLENYNNKDSKENEYVLYGVLVHSGDLNSGHYCAFLRPQNNNKWFKFDDEVVYPVTSTDVFEENFGGKSIFKTSCKKINRYVNAYMLTYIKKTEMAKILSPLSESEIPKHIGEQIKKEQEEFERHQKEIEKEKKSLKIYIVTDEIIENHKGFDLFNVSNNQYQLTDIPEIKILKTATYKEFITIVQKKYKYSQKNIRLWEISNRQNNTCRISNILNCDNEERSMKDVLNIIDDNFYGPRYIYLYMEIADPEIIKAYNSPFLPFDQFPKQILIFAKYFDIKKGTITKVKKIAIKDIEKPILSCVPILNEMIGLPVNTNLNIYEEIDKKLTDSVKQSYSFEKAELRNGDIICFEEIPSDEDENSKNYLKAPEYFKRLSNQRIVTFRNIYNINGESKDILITLSKDTPYEEISKRLAERLNIHPDKIQFSTSQNQQIGYSPKLRLCDIINNDCLLYYHELSIPLKDYENIIRINVNVLNSKHQVQEILNLLFHGDAKFSDLYYSIFKKLEIDPESPEGLNKVIYYGYSNKIHDLVIPDDKPLQQIKSNIISVYVQDLEDNKNNQTKYMTVLYFEENSSNLHGIPFLIKIRKDETYGEIKEKLLKCVPLTEKELSNDKIYFLDKSLKLYQIRDDMVPSDEYVAIAFDCVDKSRYRYPSEKAIKINK